MAALPPQALLAGGGRLPADEAAALEEWLLQAPDDGRDYLRKGWG